MSWRWWASRDAPPAPVSPSLRACAPRLQLARALLHRPRVLILDEPTGTVDPVASHELVDLILKVVAEREIAALISSHRLEEIERLHSRVLLLDRGRMRFDGPLDDLRRQYAGSRLEIAFRSEAEAADAGLALRRSRIGEIELMGETIICVLHAGMNTAKVFEVLGQHSANIVSLHDKEPPLQAILANVYQTSGVSIDEVESD